jgi:hypothetical protein
MNVTFEKSATTGKEEWLTPPEIVQALGKFDLDPCSPINRPWPTAEKHYTINDDGLFLPWEGRVWCNPPYGDKTASWLEKCALHGNVTALTFARTETKMFFETVWNTAYALLFIKGRLNFYHVTGIKSKDCAGAPSVLIAYDYENAKALQDSGIKGKYVALKQHTHTAHCL